MPTSYYLQIAGLNGGSTAQGHEGWFEISQYDFDVLSTLSLTSGGGAGAGKAQFSPLTVELALGPSLSKLLELVAEGRHLAGVRIEGVVESDGQAETVYELRLGDVVLTGLDEGNDGADRLTFGYGEIGVSVTPETASGQLGTPETYAYDVAQAREISFASIAAPTTGPSSSVPTPTSYYLQIAGLNGGSTAQGHEGWFEISQYDFDVLSTLSLTSGGGAGAGKAQFSPLTVELALGPSLSKLLELVAEGRHLAGVRIEGVVESDGQAETVYELRLGDVVLTGLDEGNDGADRLTFGYGEIGVSVTPETASGQLGTPETYAYDVAQAREISFASIAAPTTGPSSSVPTPTSYYLQIAGLNGGSTAQGHEGWFEISQYDFDVLSTLSLTSGGGAGAGKAQFSPLTVELALGPSLSKLLELVAEGRHLAGVRIEGVVESDGQAETVYELRLGDVVLTGLDEGNDGADRLTFGYGEIGVSVTPETASGQLGTPETYAYDVAQAREISFASIAAPTTGPSFEGASDARRNGSAAYDARLRRDVRVLALTQGAHEGGPAGCRASFRSGVAGRRKR